MNRRLLIALLLIAFAVAPLAQAQDTSPTPPPTVDVSQLNVASTTEIDLYAGPRGTAAFLAPDGQQFAFLSDGRTLCLYRESTQGECVDLSPAGDIDPDSLRWSPDGRYVLLTQDFFRRLRDSDIWVWDTMRNTLQDMTPQLIHSFRYTDSDWTGVDVIARWLPNGRILFLRYNRQNGVTLPPDVYTIRADGGGLQKLGTLNAPDPVSILALDVTATQIVYDYVSAPGSDSDGVWISNLDGSSPRQLIHIPRGPASVIGIQISPDQRYALLNTPGLSAARPPTPETSPISLIDIASGAPILIDPDHFVTAAGWSPQGSALLYVTHDILQPENDGVFLTNTPGTAGQPLTTLQGRFNLPTPRFQQSLIWGANNIILLSRSPMRGIRLVHLD